MPNLTPLAGIVFGLGVLHLMQRTSHKTTQAAPQDPNLMLGYGPMRDLRRKIIKRAIETEYILSIKIGVIRTLEHGHELTIDDFTGIGLVNITETHGQYSITNLQNKDAFHFLGTKYEFSADFVETALLMVKDAVNELR